MSYTILVRIDAAGECPVLLRDDGTDLLSGPGVRWRFVLATDDYAEAIREMEEQHRRIDGVPATRLWLDSGPVPIPG